MSAIESPRELSAKRSLPERLFLILAGIGLLDSAYLAWARAFNTKLVCFTGNGCNAVSASPYAHILGIPLSYLGLGVYILLVTGILMLHRLPKSSSGASLIATGLLSLNLAGALFSAYLTWTSINIIGATCNWCIISAAIMWILLPISIRIVTKLTA